MSINIGKKKYNDLLDLYKFEYPYKSINKYEETRKIYENFFGILMVSYDDYRFIERSESLKEKIKNLSGIKSKETKQYDELIQQFEQRIKTIRSKISDDYLDTYFMMYRFDNNFLKYRDNEDACKMYDKIRKSLLDEGYKKCIKYEKELILLNEYLIDLINRLNNIIK